MVNILVGLGLLVVGIWWLQNDIRTTERWEVWGIPLTYWMPALVILLGVLTIAGVVDMADYLAG